MRITIMERSYKQNELYREKNMIKEGAINRAIENIENNGYQVKSVQLVNYADEEKERILISYE